MNAQIDEHRGWLILADLRPRRLPCMAPLSAQAAAELVTAISAANATVYRVYEYAVPVTTVATVPSAYPTTAGIPGIAAYPAPAGGFFV